jgi:hypothetical protein
LNKYVKKTSLIFLFFLVSIVAIAQPGDPNEDPDNPVPLHGIGWLLAAGGAYGAKKLLHKKQKES